MVGKTAVVMYALPKENESSLNLVSIKKTNGNKAIFKEISISFTLTKKC